MFSYISEGEPSEYGFLPAGVYEGKIVKMEEGISQGAKTRGCPQLAVHISAFGPEGAATVRYYLTNSKDLAWKIDLFVKNVTGNVYQPGQQVIINPAEYLGKPCYVRLSVRQGDKPRADGSYPEFSNCEDVLGPDEARAIMAAQDRAAAGRGGAGDRDFAVGSTNVREVNDVLAAMDAMRTSLAESLEARWAAERGQREQVASLAHDLKTPLTVLRANADFVAEELEDEKDADLAAAARDIAGSVERLDGYVRLLIEASRGSGGAERAPMRPAALCEQVLAEAAQIARARGVTLDAPTGHAVAGAPEAPLDRTALARAAANLVANAAEHARSRVAVSCDVAGGHLVIEVADDGPGFSPAALERGCERLFTDDSSRSSRDGGRHYGLGLHAAAEAASAHGGSVSLANSPSGGAVATIAVPLCGA